jgi:peptide/nickel transport system substrate-binding protein
MGEPTIAADHRRLDRVRQRSTEAENHLNAKTGQGAWNAARFDNPAYDVLSKQYIAALDLSVQRRIVGEIETLLLDQTPVIYPYFCDFLTAAATNITGVYPTGIGDLFLYNAGVT